MHSLIIIELLIFGIRQLFPQCLILFFSLFALQTKECVKILLTIFKYENMVKIGENFKLLDNEVQTV